MVLIDEHLHHCTIVIRLNEKEGGAESDRLSEDRDSPLPETRLNEQTKERMTLLGELIDAN